MAMALTQRTGLRLDRADFSVFDRPGLSGVIRYRPDSLAAKTQGDKLKNKEGVKASASNNFRL